jgi:hypothetical protein
MNDVTAGGGRAVVLLTDGRHYEGIGSISDGMVHLRRARRRAGVQHHPVEDRSWRTREVREIRWLGAERSAA